MFFYVLGRGCLWVGVSGHVRMWRIGIPPALWRPRAVLLDTGEALEEGGLDVHLVHRPAAPGHVLGGGGGGGITGGIGGF